MTTVPRETRTRILNASIALTTVQSDLAKQREWFKGHGLELPAEITVLERLVTALQTVFDYSARHGYTLEGAIEAMGADLNTEMRRLIDRTERMKQAIMN